MARHPHNADEQDELRQRLLEFYQSFARYYVTNSYYQLVRMAQPDPYLMHLHNLSRPEQAVLEVGCASGVATVELARTNGISIGVDISHAGVSFARKLRDIEVQRHQLIEATIQEDLASANMGNAHFVNADAMKLPFATASFDIVHSREVLEHVVRPYEALTDMVRVLKPGGKLVVEMPVAKIDINLDTEAWKSDHGNMADRDAVSTFDEDEILAWLARQPLEVRTFRVHYHKDRTLRALRKALPLEATKKLLKPWVSYFFLDAVKLR